MKTFAFKLFVSGRTTRSARAIRNLRRLCVHTLRDDCEFVVIDVLEQPEAAESERILTTPTLVKHKPEPSRRVTGDLSDDRLVLYALSIEAIEAE